MKRERRFGLGLIALAVAAAFIFSSGAVSFGAEPPALKGLKGAERERVVKLIEAARKEGALTWWDTIMDVSASTQIIKDFKEYYGLEELSVSIPRMRTGTLVAKVEEELKAGKVTVDVVAVAALGWFHQMYKRGELLKYCSPEYKYYGPARRAGLVKECYWVSDAYVFVPAWNDKCFDKPIKPITSWNDLLRPEFKGKIVQGDVLKSLSYSATFKAVRSVMGDEFFKKLAKQDTVVIMGTKRTQEKMLTCETPVDMSAMPTRLYQLSLTTDTSAYHNAYPKEGVLPLPQPMAILKRAKHPNAAKLMIDYMRSERGQKTHGRIVGFASGREGIKHPSPYIKGIEEMNAIPFDWKKYAGREIKKTRRIWRRIFGR
ncbi:MAG: ABC transporter substrate-binding protein [Nitrospinota bacterium]